MLDLRHVGGRLKPRMEGGIRRHETRLRGLAGYLVRVGGHRGQQVQGAPLGSADTERSTR